MSSSISKGKEIARKESYWKRKRGGNKRSGGNKRKNRGVLQFLEGAGYEADVEDGSDEHDSLNVSNRFIVQSKNNEVPVGTQVPVKNGELKGDLAQGGTITVEKEIDDLAARFMNVESPTRKYFRKKRRSANRRE